MPDYNHYLYDTALLQNAVDEIVLFQNPQGSSSSFPASITNMKGAGQLPSSESMEVHHIHGFVDENVVAADADNIWLLSTITMYINEIQQFRVPLKTIASMNAFGGHYTQATAANEALIGLVGYGWKLRIPIRIPGGTQFSVVLSQGTALSTTNINFKVALDGILTRPN